MDNWTFTITDAVNREFKVSNEYPNSAVHGSWNNSSAEPHVTGGMVTKVGARLRVLVSLDNGRTAEFGGQPGDTNLRFVGYV